MQGGGPRSDEMTKETQAAIHQEVERYLRTGDHDIRYSALPGHLFLERARVMDRAMREALLAEVRRREKGRPPRSGPGGVDVARLARDKATPMVRGLFPAMERESILRLLESCVVFLTCDNIGDVLTGAMWHRTAWDLANLYLGSIGAKCLGAEASCLAGLSEETTCYVSLAYFDEPNPFADFVVHEMAHVFHNWKRERVGLPHTRYREWLLEIDFAKRETFAYACEAYSRIQERASGREECKRLLSEYTSDWALVAEGVEQDELARILSEAVFARNGWKRILRRCAPPSHGRRVLRSAGPGLRDDDLCL